MSNDNRNWNGSLKQITAKDISGNRVTFAVGQRVFFKHDVEQSAVILDVSENGHRWTGMPFNAVEVNVQEGCYFHGETWIPCHRCEILPDTPSEPLADGDCFEDHDQSRGDR